MIILDTNVVSELMKAVRDPNCEEWCAAQSEFNLHVSSITVAEILFGIELLPAGRKRDQLERGAKELFETKFSDQLLPFDSQAASYYASLCGRRQRKAQPVPICDMQIAAIALANGAALATRNTKNFEDCGLTLVNPWLVH